jgi:recombination protein RecT
MTRGQLEAIRRRSKASGSGPWVTYTEEMFRKTVLRRLAKWLPLSPELADAMIAEAAGNDGDASDAAIAAAADVLEVPADNVEKEPTDAK